jgi:hypothetical protein
VSLWRLLKIPAVFTLETSLCGGSINSKMPHFTPDNLYTLGEKLCMALIVFQDVKKAEVTEPLKEFKPVWNFERKILARDLQDWKPVSEYDGDALEEAGAEGSDSDPGQDTLTDQDLLQIIPLKQFKYL